MLLDYLRNIVATVLHIFVCIINGENTSKYMHFVLFY